jgi:hypothetical protein
LAPAAKALALTTALENEFLARFTHPKFNGDYRTPTELLLQELKRASGSLPIELEAEGLGHAPKKYARIRGRLRVGTKPIVWQLCSPSKNAAVAPSNYKLELLTRQGGFLSDQGLFSAVTKLATDVGGTVGEGQTSPVLRVPIHPGIKQQQAARIASIVPEIVKVILPAYR